MPPDNGKKRADDEDEIDPDKAPEPEPFRAPKGLLKGRPEGGPVDVKSGAAPPVAPKAGPSGPSADPTKRAPTAPPAGPRPADEIDPDKAPEPAPFQAPRGLLKAKPEAGPVEVKSGASPPPVLPPAQPPGAHVRVDRPAGGPKPHVPTPADLGRIDVRFQKPEAGPKPRIPTAEEMGRIDVQFQRGEPRLPKMEAPGEFDVIKPHAVPPPTPAGPAASPLEQGEVEVVDYRRTGPVDVTGQVPDPFGTRKRIGVVDTTFARYNMGDAAEQELQRMGGDLEVIRRTVPGVKDLAVECKVLIEKLGCELVVACGMVGRQPVDKTCAHEASLAIQWTQLQTNRHVLEVFVHEDEAKDEKELAWLMDRRTREHAENAWNLVFAPDRLRENAGKGLRQGFADAGPVPWR